MATHTVDQLHANLTAIAAHVAASTWYDPLLLSVMEEVRSATGVTEGVEEVLDYIRRWLGDGLNGFELFVNITRLCPDKKVVLNALWILTNVSSAHCRELVDLGVVPLFIEKLSDEDMSIVEQAGWGLGNLAGDGVSIRNVIHDAGGVAAALSALNNPLLHASGRQKITWTISNLCRGKPRPRPEQATVLMEYFTKALQDLLGAREAGNVDAEEDVEKETIDILWGISYLSEGGGNQVQLGIGVLPLIVGVLSVPQSIDEPGDPPVVERMVPCEQMSYVMEYLPPDHLERLCMLNSDIWNCSICANRRLYNRVRSVVCHKREVRVPTVRVIGNTMLGNDQQTQAAIDCGALRVIESIIPSLQSHKTTLEDEIKEICWLLGNVMAGTPDQCRLVMKSTVFYNFVLESLRMENHPAIRKEACWFVCNASATYLDGLPLGLIAAAFGFLSGDSATRGMPRKELRDTLLDNLLSSRYDLSTSFEALSKKVDASPKDTFTPSYLKDLADNYTKADTPSSLPGKLEHLLLNHILPVLYNSDLVDECAQITGSIDSSDYGT